MKELYSILIIIFISYNILEAQPKIQWSKTYGGSGDDILYCMQRTLDNGFILVGNTNSNDGDILVNKGKNDCLIIKVDSEGNLEWAKTTGGTNEDIFYGVTPTNDGGYIASGKSNSKDGDVRINYGYYDALIIKYNSKGDVEWHNVYGKEGVDQAQYVIQTSDDGFLVAINTSKEKNLTHSFFDVNTVLVKYDSKGKQVWEKTLKGNTYDYVYSMQEKPNTDIIISIFSNSSDGDFINNKGSFDSYLIIIDKNGEIKSKKNYGGGLSDKSLQFVQTIDKGIVVSGYSYSNTGDLQNNFGDEDCWVYKTNQNGELLWSKNYGGSSKDAVFGVDECSYGDLIFAGRTASSDNDVKNNYGKEDCWLVKLDESGEIIWQQNYGGSNYDMGKNIFEIGINTFVVAGITSSNNYDIVKNNGKTDFWLMKLSELNQSDSCYYNFNYPNFSDKIGLKILNDAKVKNDTIQITENELFKKGSVWYNKKVGIINGFKSFFKFKFNEGDNYGIIDGSQQGADGISFVIQGNDSLLIGGFGGDIGFGGIPNSIAIEIDTYRNFSKYYNDPDGNHLAVFSKGIEFNDANHKGTGLIAETSNIPTIYQDSIYMCKINYYNDTLSIYLNLEKEEDFLALKIKVDIKNLLNLDDFSRGWVGLTSSTGNAVEKHNLISWNFCSFEADFNSIQNDYFFINNMVIPNPNNGQFSLQSNDISMCGSELFIFNSGGKLLYKDVLKGQNKDKYNISLKLDKGLYIIKIRSKDKTFFSKCYIE